MIKSSILKDIRISAAAISLLLSLWVYLRPEPINVDGVLYLQTAANYLQTGWHSAYNSYNWPLYSILIAWLSKAAHLSLLHSALLLNALLIALIVIGFISILQELGANRTIQIAGALIILIYPPLNHLRQHVIRDFGYWAFALLALWILIRYSQDQRWRYSIGWTCAMLLATLFRIEGGILFLFAPLALLFNSDWKWSIRLIHLAKLYSIPFIIAFVGGIWSFKILHLPSIGRFQELWVQMQHGLSDISINLENSAEQLRQAVLSDAASENAKLILMGGLSWVLLGKLLSVLTPAYTLLSLHSLYYQLPPFSKQAKIILKITLFLSLMTLILFLGQHFFLSDRYLLFFCLILMLWAPFSLVTLYQAWCKPNEQINYSSWLFPLLSLLLFGMLLSSLIHFGHSKSYLLDASAWLEKHISPQAKLYSNSPELLFYMHRQVDFKQPAYAPLLDNSWHNYDYLAIRLHHTHLSAEKHIFAKLRIKPLRVFDNKHGDQIFIFKVPHNT